VHVGRDATDQECVSRYDALVLAACWPISDANARSATAATARVQSSALTVKDLFGTSWHCEGSAGELLWRMRLCGKSTAE